MARRCRKLGRRNVTREPALIAMHRFVFLPLVATVYETITPGPDKRSYIDRCNESLYEAWRRLCHLHGCGTATVEAAIGWTWGATITVDKRRGEKPLDYYELLLRIVQKDIRATISQEEGAHAVVGTDILRILEHQIDMNERPPPSPPIKNDGLDESRLDLEIPSDFKGVSQLIGTFDQLPLRLKEMMSTTASCSPRSTRRWPSLRTKALSSSARSAAKRAPQSPLKRWKTPAICTTVTPR